jgi:hypothetical protein
MPFQPKAPRPAKAGRKRGTPNKATQDARQAVVRLLEANSEKMGRWLTLVAEGNGEDLKPDPGKAMDIMTRLLEFHIPKLARTEVSGTPGADPVRFIIIDK